MRPMSNMIALPLMLYGSSARAPAGVVVPVPAVSNQFMFALGPAWNTSPPPVPNSQAWLSPRYTPCGSELVIGSADSPLRTLQPEPFQTSPDLPPWPPLHEPPTVNTPPFAST